MQRSSGQTDDWLSKVKRVILLAGANRGGDSDDCRHSIPDLRVAADIGGERAAVCSKSFKALKWLERWNPTAPSPVIITVVAVIAFANETNLLFLISLLDCSP
jgi:hypothetical protein